MTVEEMLGRMSSKEMSEWLRFSELEPFGCAIDDFRGGLAAAVDINMNRTEGAAVTTPFDLYPWHQQKVAAARAPAPEEVTDSVVKFFDKLSGGIQ